MALRYDAAPCQYWDSFREQHWIPLENNMWLDLTWQQCIFRLQLPRILKLAKFFWTLIRGSTIWIYWFWRNVVCFANYKLPNHKVE
jgi:hypothetical protein